MLEEAKGTNVVPITEVEREELGNLREQYTELREKLMARRDNDSGEKVSVTNRSVNSSSDCSEEEDEV